MPTTNNMAMIRNLRAGRDYYYVIRAKNKCGWGVWSAPLKVRIVEPPQARVVVTAVKGCSVKISWSVYSATQSLDFNVNKFEVAIKGSSGQYHPLPDNCDTNGTTKSCIVTMNVLSESPYNLTKGSTIIARGRATSSFGLSGYS